MKITTWHIAFGIIGSYFLYKHFTKTTENTPAVIEVKKVLPPAPVTAPVATPVIKTFAPVTYGFGRNVLGLDFF